MQFSRNWLKEFVDVKISDEELCDQLTMLGLEVDSCKKYQSKLTGKDAIIKLDLTPNRGDCFSILGVAREVAAVNNLPLMLPKITNIKNSVQSPISVSVCNEAPRYVGRYITRVNLKKKTPALIKERLKLSDIKIIDPIVDVTNYVLLELGQPLHAFDADKLEGNLEVRFAKEKEKITLLDENQLKLNKECLVIADQKKPVALAGIMGGLETGISNKSQSIYLESAFFTPTAIRGRARKFSIQTDASTRFERGVDFDLQVLAIKRASALINETLGCEFSPIQEFLRKSSIPKNKNIILNTSNINKILGTDLNKSVVRNSLRSLGLLNSVSNKDTLKVQVPSWRFDLKIEADLIEEVARLVGYNNIPKSSLSRKTRTSDDVLQSSIRKTFQSMGYNEVITYSFIDQSVAELGKEENKKLIFVENPISQNMNVMRTSLLPGLLETLSYNINQGSENIKIFEIGSVFRKNNSNKVDEREVVGGLITGVEGKDNWSGSNKAMDFFDLKGNIETVLPDSSKFTFKKGQVSYLHPGKTAFLYKAQTLVGYIGTVNPKLLDKFDIKSEVNFFEIDINEISSNRSLKFKKFSRYPLAQRDLSFVVNEDAASSTITAAIASKAGSDLKAANLFDVYVGKGIAKGKKSLTYSLSWQSKNRTLTDDEVDKIMGKIVSFLSKKFNAKLRV
jgi:phenylalanyl-tRNA synthetase beta chain